MFKINNKDIRTTPLAKEQIVEYVRYLINCIVIVLSFLSFMFFDSTNYRKNWQNKYIYKIKDRTMNCLKLVFKTLH